MSVRGARPDRQITDPATLLVDYLDFYRSIVAAKVDGLSDADLRTSRVPSGWTPIELLKHVVYMERRWLVWGFLAEPVPDPWGDADADARWVVAEDETVDELVAAMLAGGERTRSIVAAADLADVAPFGGRFAPTDEEPSPTLGWILHHVLQEYARHAGHLDIARELADGATGE